MWPLLRQSQLTRTLIGQILERVDEKGRLLEEGKLTETVGLCHCQRTRSVLRRDEGARAALTGLAVREKGLALARARGDRESHGGGVSDAPGAKRERSDPFACEALGCRRRADEVREREWGKQRFTHTILANLGSVAGPAGVFVSCFDFSRREAKGRRNKVVDGHRGGEPAKDEG